MKKIALPLAAALLALAGCSMTPTTSVAPGDGPAAEAAPSASASVDCETASQADWQEYCSETMEGEGDPGTDEETTEPAPDEQGIANFGEKFTYADGVELEMTKIVNSTFTAEDAEYRDGVKAGDPYTAFTVRVRNDSTTTLDLYGSLTVAYGPDGVEAESTYVDGNEGDLMGKLIPTKARTATYVYAIPKKHLDDVVAQVSPDYEHAAVIFNGSVK